MASKIVYVSPQHAGDYAEITVLSPKKLDELLEAGWEIIKRKSVKVSTGERDIKVESIQLATQSAERGLSAPRRQEEEETPSERAISPFTVQGRAHRGGSNEVTVIGENPDGYMGRSIAKSIPGVRIVSNMMTHAAFGLGADQAKAGAREHDNPFPPSGKPWVEWCQGFFSADGKVGSKTQAAMEEGRQSAGGKPDDEATCSYKLGTVEYEAWLWSFKKHGGRVESGA